MFVAVPQRRPANGFEVCLLRMDQLHLQAGGAHDQHLVCGRFRTNCDKQKLMHGKYLRLFCHR
jgi:hypothetical protein